MAEWKRLAEKYKWLCILTGGIGFFLAPFLWPIFLAIIFQSLSLAVPVIVAVFFITTIRKEKKNEQKCDNEKVQTRNTDDVFSENISKKGTSAKQTDETEDHLSEGNKKEQSQPLKQKAYPQHEKYETECRAVAWYQLEGKERIQNLKAKMENENIRMFSISPEGVCCVREGNRFRRIGVLRAFPCQETKALIKCLSKDHIHAVKKGKYLWLSWERSVAR